jgi:molybdenum cofactor cytidylyltransferase
MITALILAAGQSKRMGQPKMLLPWGKSTVLQTVISTFQSAGVDDVLVVTGAAREQIESLIGRSVQTVYNPDYALGEMLSSIQVGLAEKQREARAVLVGLGDQPQIQDRLVQRILQTYQRTGAPLIVPSFEKHRGHPWLVGREYWDEILRMTAPETMRDFLNHHASKIKYIEADTPSVLADLDTPDDYSKSKP